jgi:hypothetical protein
MMVLIVWGIEDTIQIINRFTHMNHTTSKTTVGILTIATGKYYDEFIPTLKDSIDQYFDASQLSVQFYCFTDAPNVRPDITGLPIAHLAWPFSTLMRFYWIKQHLDQLLKHDFLLYMDADMKVVQAIPSEIFTHDLIAVQHPGYLDASPAFEIDRQDSIYLAPQLRKTYYQGCFWGGRSKPFGELIENLSTQVDQDLKRAAIPIWHDESYLNFYMATRSCYPIPSTYAWPQGKPLNGETPYILHLEKPHNQIRQIDENFLDTSAILSNDASAQLDLYKKLYLISHEKCQRLEARLVQKHYWWNQLRERLAFYKKKK